MRTFTASAPRENSSIANTSQSTRECVAHVFRFASDEKTKTPVHEKRHCRALDQVTPALETVAMPGELCQSTDRDTQGRVARPR